MFESKSGVLLIAGVAFFAFSFISNALVPVFIYKDMKEVSVEELVEDNLNLMYQFEDLQARYPEQFKKYYGEASKEKCAEALRLGRKLYIGEGCWHCHSQFIRPVSNESARWGPVSRSWEYQNELQRPVMFGTRRIGPDLCREGGRRSNDWHAVHLFKPTSLSINSPMPEYPWFFDKQSFASLLRQLKRRAPRDDQEFFNKLAAELEFDPDKLDELNDNKALEKKVLEKIKDKFPKIYEDYQSVSPDAPNKRGLALITYIQWLGSWLEEYPSYERYRSVPDMMENPLENTH